MELFEIFPGVSKDPSLKIPYTGLVKFSATIFPSKVLSYNKYI